MKKIPKFHQQLIAKYKPGTWILPNNKDGKTFTAFADLFEWDMIERKITYHYRAKQLTGSSIFFKIKK